MAFNIMDMVANQLSPSNLGALAGAIGDDQQKVNSAMSGATPALLGGLVSTFSRPQGRQAFEQQLEQADDRLPGELSSMLDGGNGTALASSGGSMLGALLGNNTMQALAPAISRFSGMSESSCKSLLGLAMPLLMGMLKSKGKSDGLSSGGLADMLVGQKDNIVQALPSQLGDALSGTGLLDGVLGKASGAASAAATTATAAGTQVVDKGSSLMSKIIPLILLLAAVWFAYQFLTQPREPPATVTPTTVGVTQLSDQLKNRMTETGLVLSGIDTVDDAELALAQLKTVDIELGGVLSAAANLPASQTQELAGSFAELAPDLEQAVSHAYDVPGAREVLASTMDSILRKLKVISGT